MIHIAITHRKLKELLPENLSTQLMQNGVLEINEDEPDEMMESSMMMGGVAATMDESQGGDIDASGEEDMVTLMDPSMFMDTVLTEDQSGEALDFGGDGSEAEASPRKRARESGGGGDENGDRAAKRQDIGAAPVAYPGMKPDQEMVAPDLMYPNSDQVDLHTCMVCGTRLAKPHDMRRHTLTHYRVFLRAVTASHNKTCPLCSTTIKHSDKYLFHYFLTHRKFYNVDALPEQVKRHIGRSIESNLAHNQRYLTDGEENTHL